MSGRKKPQLRSGVAERYLTEDRDAIWARVSATMPKLHAQQTRELTDEMGAVHEVMERTISHDAPWRLVVAVDDAPVGFHEEAIVIVPDPAGCIAMWSVLAGPDADAEHPYSHAVTAAAEARLSALLDD